MIKEKRANTIKAIEDKFASGKKNVGEKNGTRN